MDRAAEPDVRPSGLASRQLTWAAWVVGPQTPRPAIWPGRDHKVMAAARSLYLRDFPPTKTAAELLASGMSRRCCFGDCPRQ